MQPQQVLCWTLKLRVETLKPGAVSVIIAIFTVRKYSDCTQKLSLGASLEAQWWRPPASAGSTGSVPDPGAPHLLWGSKPVHHSDWAWALEPAVCNYWVHVLQLRKATSPRALCFSARKTTAVGSPDAATGERPLLSATRGKAHACSSEDSQWEK